MVNITWLRHSLGFELRPRNSHSTLSTTIPRTHFKDFEITDLSDKIDSLTKTCDHLYKKFEEIISRADPTKFDELSVAVSEAQALKRKANGQTGDIEKLRESLDILKVKRKKL